MKNAPKVSVVMSVYNGEDYLRESIESILGQTFADFEFIIIDDGSTDATKKIIASYDDKRIVFISRSNKGLISSLNEGIKEARGQFIARQDADDVSYSTRLEQEYNYLSGNTDAVLVSSSYDILDNQSHKHGRVTLLGRDADIKLDFLLRNPFSHGASMYSREAALAVGAYNKDDVLVEDYAFFYKLASVGKVANLLDPVYGWRDNDQSVSNQNLEKQKKASGAVRAAIADELVPSIKLSGVLKQIVTARKYYRASGDSLMQFYIVVKNCVFVLWSRKRYLAAVAIGVVCWLAWPWARIQVGVSR